MFGFSLTSSQGIWTLSQALERIRFGSVWVWGPTIGSCGVTGCKASSLECFGAEV